MKFSPNVNIRRDDSLEDGQIIAPLHICRDLLNTASGASMIVGQEGDDVVYLCPRLYDELVSTLPTEAN
ncbi:hypothetical protein [Planctomicrobium piriforme]|uniref:Uncharacterized protein n=1 Tax=Planctomicrobium piriforme TaxID=1576369 RepID=A0A1I3RET8_9PLAN|nr:hypothetical protein [Planctomicrobium piriforme]SFJ44219.1 hypothetical protein SAMN05421753_12094 [Planctomicrobium piriforme]